MDKSRQKRTTGRWYRRLIRILLLLALIWTLLGAFLYTFQSKFVYHPDHQHWTTPDALGLPHENVWFQSSDGNRLHGWLISAPAPVATLLYCHGNAGNISYGLEHVALLTSLGLDVFTFDYRGFGKSEGIPTEEGTYRDAEAAWTHLVREAGVPRKRIIVYGRSLGGAVAARLASQTGPGALIVENAFISVPEAGQDIYPIFPSRLMAQFQYNTLRAIGKTHAPVLVIHAKNDRQIPFRHGEALFAAAATPKRFLEIPGGHVEAYRDSLPLYTAALKQFISDFIK